MADEAFALSPISARAAQPNEQDYEAIQEAFMETSRGRWFLGEYAKRNRNADTRMVLDAVAKIEETLASQRQPVVIDRTPEILGAIRTALGRAEEAAAGAIDNAAPGQHLGPIHRAVRIIKEISWRWREIGGDARICDLIDSELAAIEGACETLSGIDPREELRAAFNLIRDGIAELEAGESGPIEAETAEAATVEVETAEYTPAAPAEWAAADEAPPQTQPQAAAEAAVAVPAAVVAVAETPPVALGPSEPEAEIAFGGDELELEVPAEQPETVELVVDDIAVADEDADAEDEAILDMVALEMAAPDPDFDDVIAEPIAAASIIEPVTPEPAALRTMLEMPSPVEPEVVQPVASSASAAQSERSLGATIIANGLLQQPRAAANDPLLPIRRMTQAEKIAFFS